MRRKLVPNLKVYKHIIVVNIAINVNALFIYIVLQLKTSDVKVVSRTMWGTI
jgi:hypothetical protein